MTAHAWVRAIRNGQPALPCGNTGCKVVWWPDRREPRSQCKGTPVEETAADFVRALMIGGGL